MCVNRHALHCYCLHLTWEIYPITENRQEKYIFIAFSLKYVRQKGNYLPHILTYFTHSCVKPTVISFYITSMIM